jgi:hypothetical protein
MMQDTIELPDKLAEDLQARWTDVPRHLLERLVLEAYRDDIVTTREVQEILGLEAALPSMICAINIKLPLYAWGFAA